MTDRFGVVRYPNYYVVIDKRDINHKIVFESRSQSAAHATARRLNRYEFAITFAPLPVEGGTGSPVNPLAIF